MFTRFGFGVWRDTHRYDFTHCVQDSLEDIDFSICTLEFETRREPYYWLLNALKLFKPMVYEMSRLNVQYVWLSKRRLISLVETGFVRGWDDPRMPTIKGLRRRGYTAEALNRFCNEVGVSRNANMIEYSKLEEVTKPTHVPNYCTWNVAMHGLTVVAWPCAKTLAPAGSARMLG